MIARHQLRCVTAAISVLLFASTCYARGALFYKAGRNYDEKGLLGKLYRRELEARMFTHPTWHERLYCSSDNPDIDETIETYSKADGSRWLAYRRAYPSLSRLIRTRVLTDAQFDFQQELNVVHITAREIALPRDVAREMELLWRTMLADLSSEPKERNGNVTRTIYLNVTVFIAFARESGSLMTGKIPMSAHSTPAYKAFIDILADIGKVSERRTRRDHEIFGRLAAKMRNLRLRLAKSSNLAVQRTAGRSALQALVASRSSEQPSAVSPAVADLVSR